VGGSRVRGNSADAFAASGGGIFNAGILVITDSTIESNQCEAGTGGGGIANDGGTVRLVRSTVAENKCSGGGTPGGGGGILNMSGGTLAINNSTISGNRLVGGNIALGGGISNSDDGLVDLTNVTITANRAQHNANSAGGGVANGGGTITLSNTIIAGNSATNVSDNECWGSDLLSRGFNLIGRPSSCFESSNVGDRSEDPSLVFEAAGLQNNAARQNSIYLFPLTDTHALSRNSPALNAGNPAIPRSRVGTCEPVDQRGYRRPLGACDIGAFEFNAVPDTSRGGGPARLVMTDTVLDTDQSQGIIVANDGITLDCNGHKIEGPGTGPGIQLKVRKRVTVRNCVITNFANGFNVEYSTLNVFANNRVTSNRNDGFHLASSVGNIFHDNASDENGDDGFDLAELTDANFFTSNHNVRNNKDNGFNLDLSQGNFFLENTSEENDDRGFNVSGGSRYNVFFGNTACHNNGPFDFDEKNNSDPNSFRGNVFCTMSGIQSREQF